MIKTVRTLIQETIVRSLAALVRLLDRIPTLGRECHRYEPAEEDAAAADVIITISPIKVYRYGGWGSRFTTLALLSADLDQRWNTHVWNTRTPGADLRVIPPVAAPPDEPHQAPGAARPAVSPTQPRGLPSGPRIIRGLRTRPARSRAGLRSRTRPGVHLLH